MLLPLSLFGETIEVLVQDSAALANEGEELTFWQLQVRSWCLGCRVPGLPRLTMNQSRKACPLAMNAVDAG